MFTSKIRVIQQCWIKANTVESYLTRLIYVLNNWCFKSKSRMLSSVKNEALLEITPVFWSYYPILQEHARFCITEKYRIPVQNHGSLENNMTLLL
jgi:hypothetical protein